MDLTVIINKVISLFLIMIIGVYGSKKKIITPMINKGLTNILLEITLPCLVISSFIFDKILGSVTYPKAFFKYDNDIALQTLSVSGFL